MPDNDLPFKMEASDLTYFLIKGKRANTVLAVEQLMFTVRICEYVDAYTYDRFW